MKSMVDPKVTAAEQNLWRIETDSNRSAHTAQRTNASTIDRATMPMTKIIDRAITCVLDGAKQQSPVRRKTLSTEEDI